MTTLSGPSTAERLIGLDLEGGWTVEAPILRSAGATGGQFSRSYRATKDGDVAFVKALDFSNALLQPDPVRALASLTSAFDFERDLVHSCVAMSHIVRALHSGTIRLEGEIIPVPYLIFEFAEGGDVRTYRGTSAMFDLAWALRSLHHIAVGLSQLHQARIAHQDLKPSNVMIFTGDVSKLGDFGASSREGSSGPRDGLDVAGDHSYAPPEHLYREVALDWDQRRRASDLFQLGSLVAFYFLGGSMTALVQARLRPELKWRRWAGSYREVIQFVRAASDAVFDEFERTLPSGAREMGVLLRYLCEPDPNRRGHPKNAGSNRYGLERFVSRFDALARRAELGLGGTF